MTDLFYTESWTSGEDVSIHYGRYIRDPYRLSSGSKVETVPGEACGDFQADYHRESNGGEWSLAEGGEGASWSAYSSQGAIIRSATVALKYDQLAETIESGGKPRRIGDQWTMDTRKLQGAITQLSAVVSPTTGGTVISTDGLKGHWRLDRIEQMRGVRCAVLVSSAEGTFPIDGELYEIKCGSTLWLSLEIPIFLASKADSSCTTTGAETREIAATHSAAETSYIVP